MTHPIAAPAVEWILPSSRLMWILIPLLCLLSYSAQGMMLYSSRENGKRCLVELGSKNKRCWILKSIKPLDVPNTDPTVKFTQIRLEEFAGRAKSFVVGISWEGTGSGRLSFSGPKGKLFAVGSISKGSNAVHFDEFTDDSLSFFDLGLVFGEGDPRRLEFKALFWLNTVVAPIVEKYLIKPPGQVKP